MAPVSYASELSVGNADIEIEKYLILPKWILERTNIQGFYPKNEVTWDSLSPIKTTKAHPIPHTLINTNIINQATVQFIGNENTQPNVLNLTSLKYTLIC